MENTHRSFLATTKLKATSTAFGYGGVSKGWHATMIDTFSLALTHGLLFYAAWRLYNRPDLDREDGQAEKRGWGRK